MPGIGRVTTTLTRQRRRIAAIGVSARGDRGAPSWCWAAASSALASSPAGTSPGGAAWLVPPRARGRHDLLVSEDAVRNVSIDMVQVEQFVAEPDQRGIRGLSGAGQAATPLPPPRSAPGKPSAADLPAVVGPGVDRGRDRPTCRRASRLRRRPLRRSE